MIAAGAGFGEVQYDDPQHPAGSAPAGAAAEAPQETLSIDDPALTSETLDVNTEGDAYAFPPPPPDGKYRVKIKLLPTKVNNVEQPFIADIWGADNQKVLVAAIEATIEDPSGKYDGIKAYDRTVSTFLQRDKSTKVQTLLSKLVRPDGTRWISKDTRLSPRGWMDLLVRALSGEPECGIESAWEFSCQKCGEEAKAKNEKRARAIIGMHKFPPARAGQPGGAKFDPEMRCPVNPTHLYSRARISIQRFLSLAELAAK